MKLSELLYNCIKEIKQLPDNEFTYKAFIGGDFDTDQDYVNSISNAFNPLNRAIHRLSDRGKLPFNTISTQATFSHIVNLQSAIPENENPNIPSASIKSITNVVYICHNGRYINLRFRDLGNKKIQILDFVAPNTPIVIEYIPDIPNFKRSNFQYPTTAEKDRGDDIEVYDPDLEDYGINETMCSYITEYVKGFLFEDIDPQIANMHKTYAEQCFDDLEEHGTAFYQEVVQPIFRV